MKFSVITPVLNGKKYIEETIDSVIHQKGNFDIEYIIIDGNSTDGTPDLLSYYKNQIESSVDYNHITFLYISEKDYGMYDALAKGFGLANGDIICYINSDDFYLPNAFASIKKYFTENSSKNWVITNDLVINEDYEYIKNLIPRHIDQNLFIKGVWGMYFPYINQSGVFWRRALLEKINMEILRKYKLAGDFYLWKCFAKNSKPGIYSYPLAVFRETLGRLSENADGYRHEFESIADRLTFIDKLKIKLNFYKP